MNIATKMHYSNRYVVLFLIQNMFIILILQIKEFYIGFISHYDL